MPRILGSRGGDVRSKFGSSRGDRAAANKSPKLIVGNMGLFDSLMETFSDAPEWKGKRFEDFVIDGFDDAYFTIVEKTHSWREN